MSELYRLAFSGEVAEGQHPAVVKKRLAAILKLDDERMDVLFSGKRVIVKKATDEKTAARYQEVFTKAGARLRVLPVAEDSAQPDAHDASDATPSPAAQEPPPAQSNDADGLQVLPEGSDILTESERKVTEDPDIDTSHLSVQGATFTVDEPEPEVDSPNVDHITVAEPGADLGPVQEVIEAEIDVDFDLAEVGAVLKELEETEPAVDLDSIDFEVAEPGADIGQATNTPTPPPPDTDHLELDEPPK